MVIFVALQLRMLLIVHNSLPAGSRVPGFLAIMVAATVLSGPQLYILGSAWIYHEPILWSAAMAAAFNLIVVRAALGRNGFRARDLLALAAFAGLAINTRPSVGVALYLGTVLLVARTAWWRHAFRCFEGPSLAKGGRLYAIVPALARDRCISLPIVILGLLGVVVGTVNFERFGSPLNFADFNHYDWLQRHANIVHVFHNYGEFNIGRIWSGALYYATGFTWVLKHVAPFAQFLHARYQGIEAPPSIPLLTNPITVLLAGVGLYRLWWRPDLPVRSLAILRLTLVGHASAVLLICMAMYLALRYRFDFAPFMTLTALVGYRSISIAATEAPKIWRKRLRSAAIGLCVLGIISSHYVLILYRVWCPGVPIEVRRALLPLSPVSPF